MKKRIFALFLTGILILTLFSGCANDNNLSESSEPSSNAENTSELTPESVEQPGQEEVSNEQPSAEEGAVRDDAPAATAAISYPLDGSGLTLSYWTGFPGNLSSYMSSFSEHPGFQLAQERTGVKIEFQEVSMEMGATAFGLMMASGEYPDIVSGFESNFPGGLSAAYEQDAVMKLDDYIETCAPDYFAVVNSSESNLKNAYTVEGDMLAVYGFYLYDVIPATNGIFVRQDWLDNLSLDTPSTYDDWYEVLSAFKTEYDCEPLSLPSGTEATGSAYAGGYQTAGYATDGRSQGGHMFQIDGKVTSSLIDDNYRDYLTMLNQWFEEGLIYHDFFSSDTRDVLDIMVPANQVGIFNGKVDFISKYERLDTTGTISLSGISNPVMEGGDVSRFGSYTGTKSTVSISVNCMDVELALKWLNYFFTEEGTVLSNYGIEDLTYTIGADGQPQFTDLIINNPELDYGNVSRLYLVDEVVPTVYDQTRELLAYGEKEVAAINTWTATREAVYTMPTLKFGQDVNEELSALLTDIETYASECIVKFIIGDKPLSDWDAFVAEINKMNIERCIELYQQELDEYNA